MRPCSSGPSAIVRATRYADDADGHTGEPAAIAASPGRSRHSSRAMVGRGRFALSALALASSPARSNRSRQLAARSASQGRYRQVLPCGRRRRRPVVAAARAAPRATAPGSLSHRFTARPSIVRRSTPATLVAVVPKLASLSLSSLRSPLRPHPVASFVPSHVHSLRSLVARPSIVRSVERPCRRFRLWPCPMNGLRSRCSRRE